MKSNRLVIGSLIVCVVFLSFAIVVALVLKTTPIGAAIDSARKAVRTIAGKDEALKSPRPITTVALTDPELTLKIESIHVGKVKVCAALLNNRILDSEKSFTAVKLRITNGSTGEKVNYVGSRGWSHPIAALHDDLGNEYKSQEVGLSGAIGQIVTESVYPGKSASDVYLFEIPVAKAKRLAITIPGETFGGNESVSLSADLP